jgi:hypothetical protein
MAAPNAKAVHVFMASPIDMYRSYSARSRTLLDQHSLLGGLAEVVVGEGDDVPALGVGREAALGRYGLGVWSLLEDADVSSSSNVELSRRSGLFAT